MRPCKHPRLLASHPSRLTGKPHAAPEDRCLCVESIREGGAIEAWNRQCGLGGRSAMEEAGLFFAECVAKSSRLMWGLGGSRDLDGNMTWQIRVK